MESEIQDFQDFHSISGVHYLVSPFPELLFAIGMFSKALALVFWNSQTE